MTTEKSLAFESLGTALIPGTGSLCRRSVSYKLRFEISRDVAKGEYAGGRMHHMWIFLLLEYFERAETGREGLQCEIEMDAYVAQI